MGNQSSTKVIASKEKLVTLSIHEKTGRVVVFDIDAALCIRKEGKATESDKKILPECPVIDFIHSETEVYSHFFIPYLNILFDYLIEQGVRIVFFSSAVKERNLSVIPELLVKFWGETKYQALKSKGQFDIFSREDMREGHAIKPEANCVKDLKVVIRDTESLLGAILVEDDISYNAFDQQPCMAVMILNYWNPFDPFYSAGREDDGRNSVYYMLGFFKTCFENKDYKDLLLRVAVDQILPRKKVKIFEDLKEGRPFVLKMIQKGLKDVQKKVPGAVMYNLCHINDIRNNLEEKILKETEYESFFRNLTRANIPLSMFYLAKHFFDQESRLTTGQDTSKFYQTFIVNLIETMKGTADWLVEGEPVVVHDEIDVSVSPKGCRVAQQPIVLLSFLYVQNEGEIENTAKKALQHNENLESLDQFKDSRAVSVGVAFSAMSLLAAYNDHFAGHKMVYLTDIYTK